MSTRGLIARIRAKRKELDLLLLESKLAPDCRCGALLQLNPDAPALAAHAAPDDRRSIAAIHPFFACGARRRLEAAAYQIDALGAQLRTARRRVKRRKERTRG